MKNQGHGQRTNSSKAKAIAVRDNTARKVLLVVALALLTYIALIPIMHRLAE